MMPDFTNTFCLRENLKTKFFLQLNPHGFVFKIGSSGALNNTESHSYVSLCCFYPDDLGSERLCDLPKATQRDRVRPGAIVRSHANIYALFITESNRPRCNGNAQNPCSLPPASLFTHPYLRQGGA